MTDTTSMRLRDLLRMRRFIDDEIRAERQCLAAGGRPDLLQAAADLYSTTVDEMRSESRTKGVTNARMAACWLLREVGASYPEAGKVLNLHHTTVMNACRVIDGDPSRLALVRALLAQERAA